MESPVRICVEAVQRLDAGTWRVAWQVSNVLSADLVIEDAWVPHGKFRGEGHVALGEALAPAASSIVALSVTSEEPVGTSVKNAFLILRVRGAAQAWRVFARMRVDFGISGMQPVIEAVTAQSVH